MFFEVWHKSHGYFFSPQSAVYRAYYKSYSIPFPLDFDVFCVFVERHVEQLNLLVFLSIFRLLPSLALPALNKDNRTLVLFPGADDVVNHAKNGDTNEHDGSPVEALEIGGRTLGPEAPEEGVGGVENTADVDGDTPLAEGPCADGESRGGGDAAVEDGTNGEAVGNHKGDDVEGDDWMWLVLALSLYLHE